MAENIWFLLSLFSSIFSCDLKTSIFQRVLSTLRHTAELLKLYPKLHWTLPKTEQLRPWLVAWLGKSQMSKHHHQVESTGIAHPPSMRGLACVDPYQLDDQYWRRRLVLITSLLIDEHLFLILDILLRWAWCSQLSLIGRTNSNRTLLVEGSVNNSAPTWLVKSAYNSRSFTDASKVFDLRNELDVWKIDSGKCMERR